MPDAGLEGKVIVVTGATGRLGRLIVDRFVREEAILVGIVRTEQQARDLFPQGARSSAFAADITEPQAVAACFRQIGERFGHIDALIHAAGQWASAPLLDTSAEEWERLLRINLTSAFLCFREAARLMQGKKGRLIGFSASQGADQGLSGQSAYAASKAGVVRLVEAAAAEMKGTGITAHAIAPSTILYGDEGRQNGVLAERLVDLCLYLCSEAGDALNGATLRAYGA